MTTGKAIRSIRDHGILLVFPIQNRKDPLSLWQAFYPKTKMRWEWSDDGDNRVANLWHLRERLAHGGEVVYAKWYQGRATFFAPDVFAAMLCFLNSKGRPGTGLSPEAKIILEVLEESSPQSTKQIKKKVKEISGCSEKLYQAGLKELWNRLLIVGYGEVDDGAFPSLAVGATSVLFENLWRLSAQLTPDRCEKVFQEYFPADALFLKFAYKLLSQQKSVIEKVAKKRVVRYEGLV